MEQKTLTETSEISKTSGKNKRGFLRAIAIPIVSVMAISSLPYFMGCTTTSTLPEMQRVKDSAREIAPSFREFKKSVDNFKREINGALESSLKDSVSDVELSGGYYFVPEPNIFYSPKKDFFADVPKDERNIPVYLDNKGAHIPSVRDLEKAINTAMSYEVMNNIPGLDGCMMSEEEIEKGVEISGLKVKFDTEGFKANSSLSQKDVRISVNLPAELYSDATFFKHDGKYDAGIPTNCYDLWSTASEITNAQTVHKEMLSDDEVSKLVENHGVKSKRIKVNMSPGEMLIYHLVSGNEVFSFAHDLR